MTGKHTPGPWRVHNHHHMRGDQWLSVVNGAWDITHNYASKPGVIADAAYSAIPDAENLANARLIAAAPDLYEALQQAEAFISIALPHYAKDRNEAVEILPGIRTALAKASGEVFSTDENTAGMHNG